MSPSATPRRGPPTERNTLLPDLCTGYYTLLVIVVGAELLAIALALTLPGTLHDWLYRLALYTLYVQWIVIPCSALLCILRRCFGRLSGPQAALLAWLIIQAVTLLVGLGARALHFYLDIPLLSGAAMLRAQLISAILSAMLLRYLYVQYLWQQQVRAEGEARAAALQSRIRPHFLFNAMNTIAATVHANPRRADELIGRLCGLFRASLHDAGGTGTLAEELELCQGYLQLEQERLGARLKVEWHVDGLPDKAALPRLTLQPLLENAVYHGIEQLEDGGTITLHAERDGAQLRIRIANPLPENTPVQRRTGHHIALENVRQRLQHRFGTSAAVQVRAAADQFYVELSLPLEHEDPDR